MGLWLGLEAEGGFFFLFHEPNESNELGKRPERAIVGMAWSGATGNNGGVLFKYLFLGRGMVCIQGPVT